MHREVSYPNGQMLVMTVDKGACNACGKTWTDSYPLDPMYYT